MRILAIIPARGGSKGVPRKNIRPLNGKPLIAYTIEASLGSKVLTTITVSTDDEKIADTAKQLGAEVPQLRPPHLATDHSPTIDTVLHTLEIYQQRGKTYDLVCLLQPTTPFRAAKDIKGAISKFEQCEADSLISVLPVPHEYNPHWAFEPDSNGFLKIATGEKEIIPRRQELPTAYYRNGAIYLTRSDILQQQRSLYGERIAYYVMEDQYHVNIDTLADWNRAEQIAKLIGSRA